MVVTRADELKLRSELSDILDDFDPYEAYMAEFSDDTESIEDVELRQDIVRPMLERYNEVYRKLLAGVTEEEKNELRQERAIFHKSYFDFMKLCQQHIKKFNASSSIQSTEEAKDKCETHSARKTVRLPQIQLPTFDGSQEQWSKFKDTFEALIHNDLSLEPIQKFHYLTGAVQIKEQDKNVLNAFPIAENFYESAWSALKERYDDPKLIREQHLCALFSCQKMSNESATELRRIIDTFTGNLNALKAIGSPIEHWDQIITFQVVNRLDDDTNKAWQTKNQASEATWEELRKFLNDRWRILDSLSSNKRLQQHKVIEVKPTRVARPSSTFVSNQQPIKESPTDCVVCHAQHPMYKCSKFIGMSIAQRCDIIKSSNLCWNCMKPSHMVSKCPVQQRCKLCNNSHHTMLHIDRSSASTGTQQSQSASIQKSQSIGASAPNQSAATATPTFVQKPVWNNNSNSSNETKSFTSSCSFVINKQVLLSTVMINVADNTGMLHPCRALLDSASDTHFITQHMSNKLKLKSQGTFMTLTGIAEKTSIVKQRATGTIHSRYGDYQMSLHFSVLPSITGFLPTKHVSVNEFQLPNECFLADPTFYEPGRIDMLLGAEVFYDALISGSIQVKNGPMMVHTKFGWTLGGRCESSNISTTMLSCHTSQFCDDDELNLKVQRFWENEQCQVSSKLLSQEEQFCVDSFNKTHIRDESGRIVVTVPFKHTIHQLGNNYQQSYRRFLTLESKLKGNLKDNYVKFLFEYLQLNHMEEIQPQPSDHCYYIPHHAVHKPSSTSTKLRVVFDASAKSESGLSLNDVTCVGPMTQPESFDTLLKFREKPFVLKADITKMYRQFRLAPEHQNYHRILWREKPEDPIKHYKLTTVTYGTASAPFLATQALNQIGIDSMQSHPIASRIIQSNFYVDDLLVGFDSIEEAITARDELIFILNEFHLPLCKWNANNHQLLEGIPDSDKEPFDITNPIIKALGISWSPVNDQLCYQLSIAETEKTTKRSVTSQIASIYDPIGLIGPVIVIAKNFLKLLWKQKLDWDDELQVEDKIQWLEFIKTFDIINKILIPRQAIITHPVCVELHGFCDASMTAYGAAIYLRSIDQSGNVSINLLCAKSKLAPAQVKTLPKLELNGTLLLAKLMSRISQLITTPIDSITNWCDSSIALSWIAQEPHKLSTFEGNRVSEIQDLTANHHWRHIRTEDNPADVISRGIMPNDLKNCDIWWKGPAFLSHSSNDWPKSIILLDPSDPDFIKGFRKCLLSHKSNDLIQFIETRFSRVLVLTNTMAFVLRFINNCKAKVSAYKNTIKATTSIVLTTEEVENASDVIVKLIQATFFSQEIAQLQKQNDKRGEKLNNHSPLRILDPFLDTNGLLRVTGRMQNCSEFTFNQKHQKILPNCHFTRILLTFIHKQKLHAGPTALVSFVRDEFWPIKAKSIAKSVVGQCTRCFRMKPVERDQYMGILPEQRVTMDHPFYNTGIDFAGAFHIKSGITRRAPVVKVYVAVFICMCTKAIHLEAVSDLSTKAFIASLDRFVSRRGLCRHLFSDNATNFKGTNNTLQELSDTIDSLEARKLIHDKCNENNIKWHFIPPRAPHAGGLWESAVRSMKFHLHRTINETVLTLEEFQTVLCKIEAILNSRPLTPISDDPTDLRVLTAGHFLVGRPLIAKPEANFVNTNINRLDRWDKIQQLQQKFWSQWYHEYLHHLQTRPKRFTHEFKVHIGDMVIIKESNLPPMKWMIARIIHIYPSPDGVTRNVRVKTSTGEYDRHVKYLCFLPIDDNFPAGENVQE